MLLRWEAPTAERKKQQSFVLAVVSPGAVGVAPLGSSKMRVLCLMPVSFAPCRIFGYDVGAGKFTVFILLGVWISVSSLDVGGIDMYLGNWNCIFASSLLSMSTPSGVVRATFFTILLGCAALWLGYTYFL